ncbi:MAG: MFS transporter [Candidatus Lokiarchaeota archaeon]|nr:MFS transporter [Candidatus Lokiarchaeota archaeon]
MSRENKKVFKYKELTPLWIAVFIDILGMTLILPLAPYLGREFLPQMDDFGRAFTMGIILAVNAIFSAFFGPFLGKISDKYGRRPILLISQFGTLIGFLMLAFSNSLEMLVVSRIIDGIFGGNFPIAKAMIGDVVPPRDRGIQMANVGTAHVLSSLFGPAIGGTLSEIGFNMGFSGLFLPGIAAAGLTIITMFLTILILKESWPKSSRLEHLQDKQKKIKFKVRKNKKAMFYLIVWGFHTSVFMICIASISWFGDYVFGLTRTEIGLLMSFSGILRAMVRFTVFKPTVKKLGENLSIKVGLGLFLLAFVIIGFAYELTVFIIGFMIVSFAASLTRGLLSSKISKSVSPKEQGKINGLSSGLDSMSQIIGPIVAPTLLGLYAIGTIDLYVIGFFMAFIGIVPFIMTLKSSDMNHKIKEVVDLKTN